MLKRFFQVSPSKPTHPSANGNLSVNLPQSNLSQPAPEIETPEIKVINNQERVHSADSQDNIRTSDWPTYSSAKSQIVEDDVSINYTEMNRCVIRHSQHVNSSAPLTSSETFQVEQLKRQIALQQRLRQVERKLSQTLDFSTIAGTTVVETADLFKAKQVNLLRYDSTTNACQQITRYCQNQKLAWQPAFSITKTEFPTLLQQLREGTMLRIHPWQVNTLSETSTAQITPSQPPPESNIKPLPVHEAQKWLVRWPGSWLLIPVSANHGDHQRRQPLPAELSTHTEASNIGNSDFWGFMALARSERESWTDTAINAAHSITVTLTAAMQHAHQYHELMVAKQELQKLALSDGLTCLANRRRFDEHLADEWQRLAREKKPLSLILCDLDHFKRYNDTFGHPAGDRCLIRVARALLSGPQRPADLVARYGGEEFAIILPNTDTHGAWRIAQKIHESIRALHIDHAPDNEEPYVTVTMGVSTVIPGHDNTAQMLVQASDLALYHAKQQGRNRTYVNGHYNTVSQEQVIGEPSENDAQLDLMPLDTVE
ncbi:MAG: diguanylate cyclase [Cyanobacteria bacterium P01_F01_bin.3]